MKIVRYIILICIGLVLSSCEGFLDEVPRDSISPANFYNNAEDAIVAVNGAYAALNVNDYYSRYWMTSSTLAGDGCFSRLGSTSDRAAIIQLNDAGMLVNERYNIATWGAVWQAINRANAVIDNVPGIENIDADLRDRVVGEAKFLRALTYFNMVRRWGGVPLILHETSTSVISELQVTRSSADEVYTQIIADLTDAMRSLPNITEYGSGDAGRASLEAAQGLLAKVQLYRKDWANAKMNAEAVINSPSGLDLMPDPADNWWTGNGDRDNNIESIFEVQYTGISPQGHQLGNNYEPNNSGYGPGQWGTIIGSIWWFNQFTNDDKRKPATWLTEYPAPSGDSTIQWHENRYPAPHINKYRDPFNKIADGMAYNIKVLRFADVLLVAAEACNESGASELAYQYVNRVRTRAGLPDLAGLSKEQLRDSIYLEFRKELCFEGQDYEELVRQGKLIANKTAYQTYSIPPMYRDDGSVFTPDQALLDNIARYQPGTHYNYELDPWNTIFPIPQTAIDRNPKLTQSSGY